MKRYYKVDEEALMRDFIKAMELTAEFQLWRSAYVDE